MKEMNVEQMALLNCLMYYDIDFENSFTLNELITELYEDDERWQDILESKPGVMSKEKTKNVLDAIMYDRVLRDLEVANNTCSEENKQGPISVCLLDRKNKNAIFVFRGTNGREWLDNAEGFLKESSLMQKEALKFYDDTVKQFKLKERGYTIDVTGHSKGGNKAQYITIKRPEINKCYSFEGQGFSLEFMEENFLKIRERQHKITTYAAHMDYVNPLGYNIAGKRVFYKTNKPKENIFNIQCTIPIVDRMLSHSPGAYIHFEKGKIKMNDEIKQSGLSLELNRMSRLMMECPKEEKYGYFMSLMGFFQNMHSDKPLCDSKMPSQKEIKRGIKDVIKFMMDNSANKWLVSMLACECCILDDEKFKAINVPPVDTKLNIQKLNSSVYMPYNIEIQKRQDSVVKGMATVTFADKIQIENIALVSKKENELDVVLPQCSSENGIQQFIKPINREFYQELKQNIVNAYANGKCKIESSRPLKIETSIIETKGTSSEVSIQLNDCLKIEKLKLEANQSGKVELLLPQTCRIIGKENYENLREDVKAQYNIVDKMDKEMQRY